MAAVIGLEQSREPADLVRVVDALRARLREPDDAGLRRAFTDWIGVWRLGRPGSRFATRTASGCRRCRLLPATGTANAIGRWKHRGRGAGSQVAG